MIHVDAQGQPGQRFAGFDKPEAYVVVEPTTVSATNARENRKNKKKMSFVVRF